jgi:glycosyltransferase involved in cell wall biosynthesis
VLGKSARRTKAHQKNSQLGDIVSILVEDIATRISDPTRLVKLDAALLTGGFDRPYAYGLAMALIAKGIRLDVIGSDQVDSPEMHTTPGLQFLNMWPSQSVNRSAVAKLSRVVKHYTSLIRYTAVAKPKIFHILWNSKVQLFDRTLLMLYYKAMGKKIALTAHNVNQGRRDGNDSLLNRLTLRIQYGLTDHIFVHTQKMKDELIVEFGVHDRVVTVIRHPINDAFPDTELTAADAKRKLELQSNEKAILCFGRIKPYKGIEHLLSAFQQITKNDPDYRLIIAGEVQKGNEQYMANLKQTIRLELERGQVILKTQFIPDAEMEIYLKAADVMVLPYNEIFQSGVLFLSYAFGLPVIATDVGSFREEIVEGNTGFLCPPGNPAALAKTIDKYFASDLYRNLGARRQQIKDYADVHHSWGSVAMLTRDAYATMLGRRPS